MAEPKKSRRHSPPSFMMACSLAAIAMSSVTRAQVQAISALGPSSATKPAEVRIVSAEFKYAPAKVRVAAGRAVTLVLDNSGAETDHGLFLPAFGFRLRATKGSARIPQLGGSRKQPPLARKPARIQAQIQRNTGGDPCVGRGSHFMTQHRVL